MNKIIEFKNVGLTYQSTNDELEALKEVNFSIYEGEFVAIVGPSGCGKTTILSLISGLLKPSVGKIIFQDEKEETDKNFVGYMFQNDHLFEWRDIWKNVILGLEIQKNLTEENKKFVERLLKEYKLYEHINRKPSELSGGMRQRVALIRTLALNPKLLLLDEPFSALDFQTRLKVCDDVYSIIKSEHKTALLVTHDISEALSMADRIIILSSRPGTVKDIVKVDLPDALPLSRRENPQFGKLFDKVLKELKNYEKQTENI